MPSVQVPQTNTFPTPRAGSVIPLQHVQVSLKKSWNASAAETTQYNDLLASQAAGTITPAEIDTLNTLAKKVWRPKDYLVPLRAHVSAAPTMSQASFQYSSGTIKREDKTSFKQYDPAATEVLGSFVKIDLLSTTPGLPTQPLWYGFIPEGQLHPGGKDKPQADEDFVAHGMEYWLTHKPITGAIIQDGNTTATINVPLAFNEKYERGYNEVGNRSKIKYAVSISDTRERYVFSGDGDPWSVYDIIEHVLIDWVPAGIPFKLTSNTAGMLDALRQIKVPKLKALTARGVLEQLIDRRRGMGWYARVMTQSDGSEAVEIVVFPELNETISVEGVIIPASTAVVNVDPHNLGTSVELCEDLHSGYGHVIVRGLPIVSMFTVSFEDKTLIEAWTADEETAYKNGAGDGSQGTDPKANDHYRTQDKFADTFRAFQLPKKSEAPGTADFDYQAGNGTGQRIGKQVVSPVLSAAGVPDFTTTSPNRRWGKSLMRHLPLKELISTGDRSRQPDFRPMLVLIKDETDADKTKHRFINVDRDDNDKCSANVTPLDHELGFLISVHPNHLLAKGKFDENTNKSAHAPVFDYRTLVASIALQTDQSLEASDTLDPPAGLDVDKDLWKEKIVIIDTDAEMWIIATNTVVGITADGKLEYYDAKRDGAPDPSKERILRDDSPYLRQILALAKAWYGKRRRSCNIVQVGLRPQCNIGTYFESSLNQGGDQPINTVVSTIAFTFGAHASTTYSTKWSELDVRMGGVKHGRPVSDLNHRR